MGQQAIGAYQEFVAARFGHLSRSAYLLAGGDSHLAEDLVQETLGRIFANWRRVSSADNPAAYAQTILVRTHLSWRRLRRSGERPVRKDGAWTVRDASTDTGADTDLRLTLVGALKRLSERDRAVLVLRYWEDLSAQETAAVLAMSPGAVRATPYARSPACVRNSAICTPFSFNADIHDHEQTKDGVTHAHRGPARPGAE